MNTNPLLFDLGHAAAHVVSHMLQLLPPAKQGEIAEAHAAGARLELRIRIGAHVTMNLIEPSGESVEIGRLDQQE